MMWAIGVPIATRQLDARTEAISVSILKTAIHIASNSIHIYLPKIHIIGDVIHISNNVGGDHRQYNRSILCRMCSISQVLKSMEWSHLFHIIYYFVN